jgi:hypothetical protein
MASKPMRKLDDVAALMEKSHMGKLANNIGGETKPKANSVEAAKTVQERMVEFIKQGKKYGKVPLKGKYY